MLAKISMIHGTICSIPFPNNIAGEQEVIVAAITIARLYLHASDVHQNTHSIKVQYRLCSKTPTCKTGLPQKFAHVRRESCCRPIFERLIDVCIW